MNIKPFLELPHVKTILNDIELSLGHKLDGQDTYPPKSLRFYALDMTPMDTVKVVILGQDPYHKPNQAHGLAFSSLDDKIPKSLVNIFKAVSLYQEDVDRWNADLSRWAKQGVLLWNVYLSVEKGKPLSHAIKPYEQLTQALIEYISTTQSHVVFMLWGSFAQGFKPFIKGDHLIIETVHPSPLSAYRGFYESDSFRRANMFLEMHDIKKIDWR
jgi:uracil-DNA glycosylase